MPGGIGGTDPRGLNCTAASAEAEEAANEDGTAMDLDRPKAAAEEEALVASSSSLSPLVPYADVANRFKRGMRLGLGSSGALSPACAPP